ncbi:MAG: hypothetical protein GXX99_00655 [Clostridiales bacterium]|nr:hypothetical protein [Clostridiales bacterium]
MRMQRGLLLLLLLSALLLLAACGRKQVDAPPQEPPQGGIQAVDPDPNGSAEEEPPEPQRLPEMPPEGTERPAPPEIYGQLAAALAETQEVDRLAPLFLFYDNRSNELGMLPDFARGETPPFSALSFFVYLRAVYEEDELGETFLSAEDFDAAAVMLFDDPLYAPGNSEYISLRDGVYRILPMGLPPFEVHRLQSLSRGEDGIYRAVFSLVALYDDEGESQRAIEQALIGEGRNPNLAQDMDVLFSYLLQPDYADLFVVTGQRTVEFCLTGDPEFPLKYLSSSRVAPA